MGMNYRFLTTVLFLVISQATFANSYHSAPKGNVTIGIDVISDSVTRTLHAHSDSVGSKKAGF